jgi:hypothetical protein
MPDMQPEPAHEESASPARRIRGWDAFGVIVASLIGLLALLVSGYTAWVQRQQVRAEVWPYLSLAYQDPLRRLTVFNKGMGPAIVRDVRVTVDGKPQPDWAHVFEALGLSGLDAEPSTLAGTVLSPGDVLSVQQFGRSEDYARFRQAMDAHVLVDVCYCSTLGDCWQFEDRHRPDKPRVQPVDACSAPPAEDAFRD